MTYVHSIDGTTPGRRSRRPGTSKDLATGEWVMLTDDASEADHARCGWYPVTVVGTDQGDGWVLGDVTNAGPGVFTRTWVFDQATADAIAAQAVRTAKGTAVDNAVATLRQWAANADGITQITNGNRDTVILTMVNRLGVFFDRFADLIESDKL